MSREPWFILVLILAYQPGAPATGQTVSETPSLALRAGEPKVTEIPADVVKKYKLDTAFYKKHVDYQGFIANALAIQSVAKLTHDGKQAVDRLHNLVELRAESRRQPALHRSAGCAAPVLPDSEKSVHLAG